MQASYEPPLFAPHLAMCLCIMHVYFCNENAAYATPQPWLIRLDDRVMTPLSHPSAFDCVRLHRHRVRIASARNRINEQSRQKR